MGQCGEDQSSDFEAHLFLLAGERRAAVRVVSKSQAGYKPYFYVNRPDFGTYQSGFSEFTRIYRDDATVEIVAPPVLGSDIFTGWYLDGSRGRSRTI